MSERKIKVSFINLTEEGKKRIEELLADLILMTREFKKVSE